MSKRGRPAISTVCVTCNKEFSTAWNLKQHQRNCGKNANKNHGSAKRIRTRGNLRRLNWTNLIPVVQRNMNISPHIIFLYNGLQSWSIGNGRQEDAHGVVESLPFDQGKEVLRKELETPRRFLAIKVVGKSGGSDTHMMVLILDKDFKSGVFYDPLGIYSPERINFILKLSKFLTSYNVKHFCDRVQVPGTLECQRHCANFTCKVASDRSLP